MKILFINPNTSDSVSELIRAEAQRSASPGTEIEVLTAPFGVAYIETRFEAMLGAYAAAQLAGEHLARYDALVVAAFGDPGLAALREVLPCPVTGLTEAALASACLLGQRFSIVAISQRIRAWYRETVQANGFEGRLASIRGLDQPLADIGAVQDDQGRPGRARRALRRRRRRRRHRARRRAAGRAGAQPARPAAGAGGRRRVQRRAPCRNAGRTAARPRHARQLRAAAREAAPRPAALHRGAAAPPLTLNSRPISTADPLDTPHSPNPENRPCNDVNSSRPPAPPRPCSVPRAPSPRHCLPARSA